MEKPTPPKIVHCDDITETFSVLEEDTSVQRDIDARKQKSVTSNSPLTSYYDQGSVLEKPKETPGTSHSHWNEWQTTTADNRREKNPQSIQYNCTLSAHNKQVRHSALQTRRFGVSYVSFVSFECLQCLEDLPTSDPTPHQECRVA